MKSKSISMVLVSAIALIMALGLASAAVNLNSVPNSIEFLQTGNTQSFNVSTANGEIMNFSATGPTINGLTFTLVNASPKTNTDEVKYNLTLDSVNNNNLQFGENSGSITVTATNTTDTATKNVGVSYVKTFCEQGADSSSLSLDFDMENRGEGDDDEWIPLDTIEVDVELDNNRNQDLNDVVFELGLFKENSNNDQAEDLIWLSEDDEQFEYGDIDEDENGDHTFEFRVDPSEFDSGNYRVVVKAYEDGDEQNACQSESSDFNSFGNSNYYAETSIDLETDQEKMVIVDTESYPSISDAYCGQQFSFTADVWNIGDEDFPDQIAVNLFNKDLQIDMTETAIGDFDSGDREKFTFSFLVPKQADKGVQTLYLQTYYDYDEDDEEYDERSDDTFPVKIDIQGQCSIPKADIAANLDQEENPKAGETLSMVVTVTNTGEGDTNYTVNLRDYLDWASNGQISNNFLNIPSGSSEQIQITMDVKEGVEGEQTFTIETTSEGEVVNSQPVQVTVEPTNEVNLNFAGNAVISILITLIALAIIVIVVILIVRAIRKK